MPPGVGVAVAPFSFDTQYRPSIPWDYSKSLGDVNCFGMYFWGLSEELARPPSLYVIDSHTLADRPTRALRNQPRPAVRPIAATIRSGSRPWPAGKTGTV